MISVAVTLDSGGRLVRLVAEGHAGKGRRGEDLACAAFSLLARSAYEALAALPGFVLEGTAPREGSLSFAVKRADEARAERALGITDVLLAGISGLEREFPGAVELRLDRYWRE